MKQERVQAQKATFENERKLKKLKKKSEEGILDEEDED